MGPPFPNKFLNENPLNWAKNIRNSSLWSFLYLWNPYKYVSPSKLKLTKGIYNPPYQTHQLDCDIWFKEWGGGIHKFDYDILLLTNKRTNKWSDILRWVPHPTYTLYNLQKFTICTNLHCSEFVHTLHLVTLCVWCTLNLSHSAFGRTLYG